MASVASLMRTMESVLHSKSPMQSLICDHMEEFLDIHQKVSSLEVFLKKFEKENYSGLEARIKNVADVVEHIIQLRLTETLMENDDMQKKEAHQRLCNSLQEAAEEIDHAYKESTKFPEASNKLLVSYSSLEKDIPNVNKNNMVGRGDEMERLLEDLTRCYSGELDVISIIGMGGIGKTTLAKELYNDASVRSHFDVCAWATISQQHNVKEILLNLLCCTKGDTSHKEDESELADMLQKSLKGKRYLVVMDDLWSSKAWDDLIRCFPDQNNASRILLTTRNTEVAQYSGTDNLSLQMDFMDSDDSWNLFTSAAFSNETLPSELESIGKNIIDKCHGLPLTIVVVAGLLSKLNRTTQVWEAAAENIMSFVTNDPDKRCLHVLGLSYNNLPSNVKPCLLYFGIFPEDSEISVKRLVRLWIGEGFLKLEKDLEEQAQKCLEDLIDRCLVLVSKKSQYENKIRSCKVHDLIYEMCLREIGRENFFIMNEVVFNGSAENNEPPECHKMQPSNKWMDDSYRALLTPGHHHLIMGKTDDDDDNNILRRTHSLFYFSRYSGTFALKSALIHFNLLRILDFSHIKFINFPPQILCLIWLRYLAFFSRSEDFKIPPEIRGLWNLQILIVKHMSGTKTFTDHIWELTQLRHLRLRRFYLPNPPSVSVEGERSLGFPEIHTIMGLSPSSCTKEVISGIRNIKKLGICGGNDDYGYFQEYKLFDNLVHLYQLETLSLTLYKGYLENKISLPSAKAFPATLKKLKLERTCLRWEELNIIGELPNLEVLKLVLNACVGEEWHPIEGRFSRLKLLLIGFSDLKYWKATNDNFPVLERLFIESCLELEEIPIEFADILSLQLIELKYCLLKLSASAARIQQEQEDLGNEPINVRFDGKVVSSGDAYDDDDSDDDENNSGDAYDNEDTDDDEKDGDDDDDDDADYND